MNALVGQTIKGRHNRVDKSCQRKGSPLMKMRIDSICLDSKTLPFDPIFKSVDQIM